MTVRKIYDERIPLASSLPDYWFALTKDASEDDLEHYRKLYESLDRGKAPPRVFKYGGRKRRVETTRPNHLYL